MRIKEIFLSVSLSGMWNNALDFALSFFCFLFSLMFWNIFFFSKYFNIKNRAVIERKFHKITDKKS